jgi:coenzyme Q-binding protein COQ10
MTTYAASRMIAAPSETLFDLVADVERYPEFLPLWTSARVLRHRGNVYYTEQEVGVGPIRRCFHTRTELIRPTRIDVTSTDQTFRVFRIGWDFADRDRDCRINIVLTWEVRWWMMQRAIDLALPDTARMMIDAFERRAREFSR